MEVTEEKETQTEVVSTIAAPLPRIHQSSIVNFLYLFREQGIKDTYSYYCCIITNNYCRVSLIYIQTK